MARSGSALVLAIRTLLSESAWRTESAAEHTLPFDRLLRGDKPGVQRCTGLAPARDPCGGELPTARGRLWGRIWRPASGLLCRRGRFDPRDRATCGGGCSQLLREAPLPLSYWQIRRSETREPQIPVITGIWGSSRWWAFCASSACHVAHGYFWSSRLGFPPPTGAIPPTAESPVQQTSCAARSCSRPQVEPSQKSAQHRLTQVRHAGEVHFRGNGPAVSRAVGNAGATDERALGDAYASQDIGVTGFRHPGVSEARDCLLLLRELHVKRGRRPRELSHPSGHNQLPSYGTLATRWRGRYRQLRRW